MTVLATSAQRTRLRAAPLNRLSVHRKIWTHIQALRAIAVAGVVVNHIFPTALPGGYAGVDVFFVISGFLITSQLLSQPPRRLRDLGAFWARRIRRLLPAALTVIIFTLVISRLFAPQTAWTDTARMARAAATYWVNWLLAHDQTNYFTQGSGTTPLQHYWSLSVEEQFYLLWPVVLFVLVGVSRRLRLGRREHPDRALVLVVLSAICAASFYASVEITSSNPAGAYFVTWTRAWELGAGGLLALLAASPSARASVGRLGLSRPAARTSLTLAGLAAIVVTFACYDNTTAFPGYAALLPVIGATVIIASRPDDPRRLPDRVLALRPVQWLGDVSYSLYLWHWPIWLLLPDVLQKLDIQLASGGFAVGAITIVLALVVAAGSKHFIEDRLRFRRPTLKLGWLYIGTAFATSVLVVLATLQIVEVNNIDAAARVRLAALQSNPCLGAAAMDPSHKCGPSTYSKLALGPVAAAKDASASFTCESTNPYPDVTCVKGDQRSKASIALIGNSHMDQWSAAFNTIGIQRGIKVTTHLASACVIGMPGFMLPAAERPGCAAWEGKVIAGLKAEKPNLVVISNRQAAPTAYGGVGLPEKQAVARAASVLRRIRALGLPVVVLTDPPFTSADVPLCVEEAATDMRKCTSTIKPDYFAIAASRMHSRKVMVVSLDRYFDCTGLKIGDTCQDVVGNVIVYYDEDAHMTLTMVKTLTPYLDKALRATGLMPGK